jgi:hypothetical protein
MRMPLGFEVSNIAHGVNLGTFLHIEDFRIFSDPSAFNNHSRIHIPSTPEPNELIAKLEEPRIDDG